MSADYWVKKALRDEYSRWLRHAFNSTPPLVLAQLWESGVVAARTVETARQNRRRVLLNAALAFRKYAATAGAVIAARRAAAEVAS